MLHPENICSLASAVEANTRVQVGGDLPGGLHVRGISGGERRRLSIACATVAAPALIFLDECTSGKQTAASRIHLLVLVQDTGHAR